MKIGIIHDSSSIFGGIENQIVLLVKKLLERHEIFYFTSYPDSKLLSIMNDSRLHVITLHGGLVSHYRIIARSVKQHGIQILQTHNFNQSVKYRFVKLLVPSVKIVNRVHTYIACSWVSKLKKQLYYLFDSVTSILVSKYLVNGKYLMLEFAKNTFVNRKKLSPIIDGIEGFSNFNPVAFSEDDKNRLNLLMIANVIPHKGHNVLINAMHRLAERGIFVHCDILGATDRDNAYFVELQALIAQYGLKQNINFLGFTNDVGKYIEKHKIVVLPSDSEGTPNCIMEAMSAGRLVIVSNTGGVSEMVKDKQTGFLHKPLSDIELANLLDYVVSLPVSELNQIAINGQVFWRENLSLSVMVDKFEKIYSEI